MVSPSFWRTYGARRPNGEIPGVKTLYVFSASLTARRGFVVWTFRGSGRRKNLGRSVAQRPKKFSPAQGPWYLLNVVSSAPIEHSAYFDLTSLQKCEEGEVPFERAFRLRACGPFPLHSSPRPLLVLAFPLRRGEAPGWVV
jgi:hypothetical protein